MSSELTGYPVSSLGIDMFSELTGLIDSLGVTYTLGHGHGGWCMPSTQFDQSRRLDTAAGGSVTMLHQ